MKKIFIYIYHYNTLFVHEIPLPLMKIWGNVNLTKNAFEYLFCFIPLSINLITHNLNYINNVIIIITKYSFNLLLTVLYNNRASQSFELFFSIHLIKTYFNFLISISWRWLSLSILISLVQNHFYFIISFIFALKVRIRLCVPDSVYEDCLQMSDNVGGLKFCLFL